MRDWIIFLISTLICIALAMGGFFLLVKALKDTGVC